MEGHYDKKQVATILGVSLRQVGNLLANGSLTRVYGENTKAWIPKTDVDRLISNRTASKVPTRDEFEILVKRMEDAEHTIDMLKLLLGQGPTLEPKSEVELLIFRQYVLDMMAKRQWGRREISQLADMFNTLLPDDVERMVVLRGAGAWVPIFELNSRLVRYIESDPVYPGKGLDVLYKRLVQAKDRLYGLIYTASKVHAPLRKETAEQMIAHLEIKPGVIDSFVGTYISEFAESRL